MRIAVLGSTGMAGHVVAQYLEERGHLVYRTSRSETNTDTRAAIDAADFETLGAWLDRVAPEAVVNCVGVLQRSCEERGDLAVLLNAYLPHWLERRYQGTAVKVIHLSTDCVFSGERGGYLEDDLPDGRTMYDRSKSLGEICNSKDLTFRMSIVGPDIDPEGTGLFNWFMGQRGPIQGYSKAIWNGVTTIELARAIDAALTGNLAGIYHLVQPVPIDKCSLLELFAGVFQRSYISIQRIDGLRTNKSLVNTRRDFPFAVKGYEEQIRDMYHWIRDHRVLYPHYFLPE